MEMIKMYKILIGYPAMFPPNELLNEKGLIIDKELEFDDYANIWFDFEVSYDSENESYHIGFETMLGFKEEDGCKNWIKTCLDIFTDYMVEHNYDTTRELDMDEVFTIGININTDFKTIEEAYAYMKFVVNGFNGKALHC